MAKTPLETDSLIQIETVHRSIYLV